MDQIIKTAVGVFIGALAAAFTWEGIQAVRLEIAMQQANEQMKKTAERLKLQSKQQTQAQIEANNQRAAEIAENVRLANEAKRLQILREAEKAAAFKRFYEPSERCKADAIQMDCANAYMKAKTIFESQYQPKR